MSEKCDMSECFFGSVTVGERGQVVIPVEARTYLNLKPGDKIIVMKHPSCRGLMLTTFSDIRQFLDNFGEAVEKIKVDAEVTE